VSKIYTPNCTRIPISSFKVSKHIIMAVDLISQFVIITIQGFPHSKKAASLAIKNVAMGVRVIVFNATFNNISVISWR